MVYKKTRFKKKGKKKYGKPKYTVKKNAMAIKKIKREVEYKRYDKVSHESATTITQNGIFVPLNTLYQGTDQDARIGAVVNNKKLHIRALFEATADCVVRFGIIRWEDVNADDTALTMSYIFKNVDPSQTASTNYILSMKNLENNSRYKIIYDDVVPLDTTQFSKVPWVYTHKMNSKTEYIKDSVTSLQEDILKNCYFVFFVTDIAANQPTVKFISRWTYTDM